MKNYRNAETKEEMLQNIEEMTELLDRVPDSRNVKMLQRSLEKHGATTWGNPEKYQDIVASFVQGYAFKLYEDEDIGLDEMLERVYAEMVVE